MIFTVTGAQTNNRVFIIYSNNEESARVQEQIYLLYTRYNEIPIVSHAHTTTFCNFSDFKGRLILEYYYIK